jgi:hypothetical protein
MTWTYDGSPGTDTAATRRDSVRFLVGDTDTNDQQSTDEEISFCLSQASNDVYLAAAIVARGIAATYARSVDSSIESVRIAASQRQAHYMDLAKSLDAQATKYGSTGLGDIFIGGISEDAMETVREDDDRVRPQFRLRQFRNPPTDSDYDDRRY